MTLILFYYTSSKLTKLKEEVKSRLEADYAVGGQRNYIQVFANSILATIVALIYMIYCGEDRKIEFISSDSLVSVFNLVTVDKQILSSYLSCIYIAHYACATADTWASEVGILSKAKPRLVTTLLLREVPHGTNGGMSLLGTVASFAGGLFIGLIFFMFEYMFSNSQQYRLIIFGGICGFFGSLFDSLLGATLQATYYSKTRKCIVKSTILRKIEEEDIILVSGRDILTNEQVNFYSIALTMLLAVYISPKFIVS